MNSNWVWLLPGTVLAIHDRQLAEHGGAPGIRDKGLLQSALARPENLAAHGRPDAFGLAAAYAWGMVRNHPFIDGNKRTAWVCARLFLSLNGVNVAGPKVEAVLSMVAVASGEMEEAELAEKIRGW